MIQISPNIWAANGIGWLLVKTVWPLFAAAIAFRILEVVVQKKAVRYFLRKNRIEFFTLVFAVVGYIVSYAFVNNPTLSFLISIVVTFIASIVLIYSKTREKDFYFIPLRSAADKEDWIGEGTFQYERVYGTYAITNSYSGFIFSKTLTWSDYVLDFEFKILNTSLGIILRATNLSNLVMLQLLENGIKAHIRINGFWQIWEPETTGMVFHERLNLDRWYRGQFQCDKGSIRIRIYGAEDVLLFDRSWRIPSGHITFTAPQNSGLITQSVLASIPFPINLEYGTAGFRNDNQEKALVRNVLIEKLQGIESAD